MIFLKKIRKGHEKKAQNAAISPLLFLCNKGKYLPARDQWRFRVSSSANRMTMLNGGIDDLDGRRATPISANKPRLNECLIADLTIVLG